MSDTKDLIQRNIEARVEKELLEMRKAIEDSMLNFFPNQRASSYDTRKYIEGAVRTPLNTFFKEIEPIAKAYLTQRREKQFEDILTNLGSYLEMINH